MRTIDGHLRNPEVTYERDPLTMDFRKWRSEFPLVLDKQLDLVLRTCNKEMKIAHMCFDFGLLQTAMICSIWKLIIYF